MTGSFRIALVTGAIAFGASAAHGQSWRLRLDAAAQRVEFRGITPDSIAEGSARIGSSGGLESPDGFAVECIGDGYCRFYRPGALATGAPASIGATLSLWGLGIPGLSIRANVRALTDLSGAPVWPGTSPTLRIIEGYAEYIHEGITAQIGRTIEFGRLASVGTSGLDGARITWRPAATGFEFGAYGGWGTARGTILPVTSPAVDPLADYQPSSRQIVIGLLAAAHLPGLDVQTEYRRELDPLTHYIVAERAAASLHATPVHRVGITAGLDYDIAQAQLGSADASVTYTNTAVSGTLAARHYRPFFDLWTVWGVFSPVPFNGVSAAIAITPMSKVQLRSRVEWYRYDNADVNAAGLSWKEQGWRWAVDGTIAPADQWAVDVGTHGEVQPGASSAGADIRLAWRPTSVVDFALSGGNLARPLELRFQDAGVTYVGIAAGYRTGERWRLDVAVDRYWEARDRPDAASIDWNQWRLSARASLTLRSSADRWLPPARPPVSGP